MKKDVGAAIVRLNEAEATVRVVQFSFSDRHAFLNSVLALQFRCLPPPLIRGGGAPRQCVGALDEGQCTCNIRGHHEAALRDWESMPMPKVEVKRALATMTISDKEPHWIVEVDYGAFEVSIPLPARYLATDDFPTQRRQADAAGVTHV